MKGPGHLGESGANEAVANSVAGAGIPSRKEGWMRKRCCLPQRRGRYAFRYKGHVHLESPARRFVIVRKLLNKHGWHIFAVKEL